MLQWWLVLVWSYYSSASSTFWCSCIKIKFDSIHCRPEVGLNLNPLQIRRKQNESWLENRKRRRCGNGGKRRRRMMVPSGKRWNIMVLCSHQPTRDCPTMSNWNMMVSIVVLVERLWYFWPQNPTAQEIYDLKWSEPWYQGLFILVVRIL